MTTTLVNIATFLSNTMIYAIDKEDKEHKKYYEFRGKFITAALPLLFFIIGGIIGGVVQGAGSYWFVMIAIFNCLFIMTQIHMKNISEYKKSMSLDESPRLRTALSPVLSPL